MNENNEEMAMIMTMALGQVLEYLFDDMIEKGKSDNYMQFTFKDVEFSIKAELKKGD